MPVALLVAETLYARQRPLGWNVARPVAISASERAQVIDTPSSGARCWPRR
jgi:hypothetical protein